MTKRRPRAAIELPAGIEDDGSRQSKLKPVDAREIKKPDAAMRHRNDQHRQREQGSNPELATQLFVFSRTRRLLGICGLLAASRHLTHTIAKLFNRAPHFSDFR